MIDHAGTVLASELQLRGLEIKEAAAQLDCARTMIHDIIAGRKPMSVRFAKRVETVLGISAREMLVAQVDGDLRKTT